MIEFKPPLKEPNTAYDPTEIIRFHNGKDPFYRVCYWNTAYRIDQSSETGWQELPQALWGHVPTELRRYIIEHKMGIL